MTKTQAPAKTQRVVISQQYGGFGLSAAATGRLRELGWTGKYASDIERDDPLLLAVIDELGTDECSDMFSNLSVIEIPSGIAWHVHEYDGYETLHENHRSWGSLGEEMNCGG